MLFKIEPKILKLYQFEINIQYGNLRFLEAVKNQTSKSTEPKDIVLYVEFPVHSQRKLKPIGYFLLT